MPSKIYNSSNLRRLSWPTLINPNALICKSHTMIDFNDGNLQPTANNCKELRLVKLNNSRHSKANSTIVDNLFRSIRKRKLKHPINCFNRKNVKLQLLLSCPTNERDYLQIVNWNKSIRSLMSSSYLTQSEINLTELDSSSSLKRLSSQGRRLRRSRSSIGEFEHLSKYKRLQKPIDF